LNHDAEQASAERRKEDSSQPYTATEIAVILSIEALQAVHDIISQLQRLSTAIRRASAREYDVQLAKKRDIRDSIDEGAGDEECMINLVRHRFKNANEELCKSLGTALSFRMRRFRNCKRLYDQRIKTPE
jgi:hypothetical protein